MVRADVEDSAPATPRIDVSDAMRQTVRPEADVNATGVAPGSTSRPILVTRGKLFTLAAEVAHGRRRIAFSVDGYVDVHVHEEIVTRPCPMILKLFTKVSLNGRSP